MAITRPQSYIDRYYRAWTKDDGCLASFTVTVKETDLLVRIKADPHEVEGLRHLTEASVKKLRLSLETFLLKQPSFQRALEPLVIPDWSPWIAKLMAQAAQLAGVGPMAAVAGAIAWQTGEELKAYSSEVIVENGGDIYIASTEPRVIAIFAGESPFSGRLGIKLRPCQTPAGVCTSAGTVGPSLSFGTADTAMVVARNPALADAVATAMGNRVLATCDLQPAVEWAVTIPGVTGALAIKEDRLAVKGDLELVRLNL
ncbi:MAG: UPF0280 family protein [Firmicutes bacterium]|nr:UPF0280 family protein [Bacillota bacterium]